MNPDSVSSPAQAPAILGGLGEIAGGYDALLCDVWGVVHDGRSAHGPAVEALRRFRAQRGPVILLSNAPRSAEDVEQQFARLHVPKDCYDSILTSGMLARDDIARRSAGRNLPLLYIGPDRDLGIVAGLSVERVEDVAKAQIVLCTGLVDDKSQKPEDYRPVLVELKARELKFLCANPDIVVRYGERLIFCAGALARLYTELGGCSVYFGKPHGAIYVAALARLRGVAKRDGLRVLVVGDGLETDIRGANGAGLDAVFIADGIHGDDIPELTPPAIAGLVARAGVTAKGAMRALVW
ncbi:MAG TPA: TIGR01459 family HAD-type hydrolase [Rhizomicrobium sp.]|nr:TIGR01459 family HAD-type hydrolase [Rhizomicrobium sp.]